MKRLAERSVWMEIDLDAITNNVSILRKIFNNPSTGIHFGMEMMYEPSFTIMHPHKKEIHFLEERSLVISHVLKHLSIVRKPYIVREL